MTSLNHIMARVRGDRAMQLRLSVEPTSIEDTVIPVLLRHIQTGVDYRVEQANLRGCGGLFVPSVAVPIQRVTIHVPRFLVVIDDARNVQAERDGIPFAIDATLVAKRKITVLGGPGWALTYLVTRSENESEVNHG